MEYNFREVEKKWQDHWSRNKTFRAENNSNKPKYYVLDMFPYPSGAGLHVGHPLGYIASDIFARYKRLKGFNVLHPMGYDAFGLPAEQYAIQTGQHPAVTTEQNISRYREQLDKIGFSFDWDREVRTSDPKYYKWTQWIFIQLFRSWYNNKSNKAESIDTLIAEFEKSGNAGVNAVTDETRTFTADEWKAMSEKEQQEALLNYRLAYLSDTMVNWCPQLGTVLANEEVKDGVSERGGYPVVRKLMQQWSLRITAYAERLLSDLDTIDWPESLKEAQRNWIGKSEGSSLKFKIRNHEGLEIEVFTTRPDTVFGVSFLTLAPEHELVDKITEKEYRTAVEKYVTNARNRSERDRMADVKTISGEFTGAYAVHPFTGKNIPIWIGDYVLAGYGTGAVMAVPGHDTRDYAFAKHFSLPIIEVVEGGDLSIEAYDAKEGKLVNSDFLNGLDVKEAVKRAIAEIEKKGIGKGRTNYRLRDAIFSRQRYWGEPFPVYYKDGIPYVMDENDLPLELPEVDKYLPTETGEPPLARAKNWKTKEGYPLETNTMPGWAGSSWYFLRYMDPQNEKEFASKEAVNYWQNVDLYIGGAEHATGHLLYVRFWTKFLFDLGYIPVQEPAKKLINQGMIQGVSEKMYAIATYPKYKPVEVDGKNYHQLEFNRDGEEEVIRFSEKPANIYISAKARRFFENVLGFTAFARINVDINYVEGSILNIPDLAASNKNFFDAVFICEGGFHYQGKFTPFENGNGNSDFDTYQEVEKMSKSKMNVVTPDSFYHEILKREIPGIIDQHGADTLRMYEMFLGPLEQSKPWNTNGISGVSNFIRRLWRLYHDQDNNFRVTDEEPTKEELKTLHKTIKKISEDIERFSFNTSVSTFMVCVNELTEYKCHKRAILEPLAIIISPYAPHIAEELWSRLGHTESVAWTKFPEHNEEYLAESSFTYPVSVNGKLRFKMDLPITLTPQQIEKEVIDSEEARKYLEGKTPKKVVVVPNRIVNIVV
jgi:leucyl-tRNA synthetase